MAWFTLALFMIAATLGYTGASPLTEVTREAEGLRVIYPRFARQGAAEEFGVRLLGGNKSLRIANAYLARVRIDKITPAPEREIAGHEFTEFVFATFDEETAIYFHVNPVAAGVLEGRISAGPGKPETSIRQYVYF